MEVGKKERWKGIEGKMKGERSKDGMGQKERWKGIEGKMERD